MTAVRSWSQTGALNLAYRLSLLIQKTTAREFVAWARAAASKTLLDRHDFPGSFDYSGVDTWVFLIASITDCGPAG